MQLLLRTEGLMMKTRYTKEKGRKDSQGLLYSKLPISFKGSERDQGTHYQPGIAKF